LDWAKDLRLKYKILVTYPIYQDAIRRLEEVATIKGPFQKKVYTQEKLVRDSRGVDAVVLGGEKFTVEVIDATDRLKVIGRFGVGLDNVDLDAATRKGVFVTFTPVLEETCAELTLGLVLALARRIVEVDFAVRSSGWEPEKFMGHDVHGATLGIIGLGRIGSAVARLAGGFSMKVLYYSRTRKQDLEKVLDLEYVDLDALLKGSDFVSLHVPLNDKTVNMIGERELRLMKKTAYLINISRGLLVDEMALYKALAEGWIAGAGLDVLSMEPPSSENPLLKMRNVVLTPHVGSATVECRRRMSATVVDDVLRVLEGKMPRYLANPEVLKTKPLPP
jgi:glyoxylate reductase